MLPFLVSGLPDMTQGLSQAAHRATVNDMSATRDLASDAQFETRRIIAILRDAVADADLGHSEVESRAGFSPGYLSQLLAANIELKLSHILAILAALEIDAATFFQASFPQRRDAGDIHLPAHHDAASVYGFGIESLASLRQRLERFEDALCDLCDTGVLGESEKEPPS